MNVFGRWWVGEERDTIAPIKVGIKVFVNCVMCKDLNFKNFGLSILEMNRFFSCEINTLVSKFCSKSYFTLRNSGSTDKPGRTYV